MDILRMVLAVVAGLFSVVATEVGTSLWMSSAPADVDLTGSFFFSVVIPVVLFLHVLMAFVLWKVFEPNPVRNATLYVAAHAGFQAWELITFGNPTSVVAGYVVTILVSGAAVTSVYRRYLWCPACARVPDA